MGSLLSRTHRSAELDSDPDQTLRNSHLRLSHIRQRFLQASQRTLQNVEEARRPRLEIPHKPTALDRCVRGEPQQASLDWARISPIKHTHFQAC